MKGTFGMFYPVSIIRGSKGDHSTASSAEVKNAWSFIPIHTWLYGVVLKHGDFYLNK